jgi:hypothetical protein
VLRCVWVMWIQFLLCVCHTHKNTLKGGCFLGWGFLFFTYYIQHCFICRPSDSTVLGSNPGPLQLVQNTLPLHQLIHRQGRIMIISGSFPNIKPLSWSPSPVRWSNNKRLNIQRRLCSRFYTHLHFYRSIALHSSPRAWGAGAFCKVI